MLILADSGGHEMPRKPISSLMSRVQQCFLINAGYFRWIGIVCNAKIYKSPYKHSFRVPFDPLSSHHSLMPRDGLWNIQLLQILLLFLRQRLSSHIKRLINPVNTAESNNRTADPLINPRQRNLTHLPALLLSQLLNTRDGLVIGVG